MGRVDRQGLEAPLSSPSPFLLSVLSSLSAFTPPTLPHPGDPVPGQQPLATCAPSPRNAAAAAPTWDGL